MRIKVLVMMAISMLFLLAIPVSADTVMENPSLYSFADVVQKLPEIWTKNPADVQKLMETYPDFNCWHRYDIIGCQSVNNIYSAEIIVNFQFTSEADSAELKRCNFSMMIDSHADVQKVLQLFWLPEMKAAKIGDVQFPDGEVTLYFSTDETLMTYTVDFNNEGVPWLIMVDMGLIRG